jgi:hypothetical protein
MFNTAKRRILKTLDAEISRAKRFGYYVGILLVDVAEETPRGVHKHLPGVTVNVRHFRSVLREYDTVIKTKLRRYTVVLPHLEEGESIRVVKDRITFTAWTQDWGPVNVGIAIYPTNGNTSREILQAAEKNLKEAIELQEEDALLENA